MRLSFKALLAALVFFVLFGGSARGVSGSLADIDGDHDVDAADLSRIAQRWLDAACLVVGCEEDIAGGDGVDGADFAALAGYWGARSTNVVINEFMAINKYSTYATVEGQPVDSDWVEIYNPGPGDVNLSGWYLTDEEDELSKWPMPDIVLGANRYLLIFCSDIDSDDHPTNYPYFDGTHYHTNFELAGAGEYLALVDPHLYVIHEYRSSEYAFESFGYPAQQQDVSYGLYDSVEQYFMSATPGSANTAGHNRQSGVVHFSRESGTFVNSFQLTLSTPEPDGVIRYTTNSTVPTASSAVYTSPLTISSATEVMARVFEPSKAPGPFASRTYVALANDVANFTSDIPLVVVDTHGGGIGGNSYRRCSAVFVERPIIGGRTQLTQRADFAGRCGIRVRGSSTAGAPKHQYSFETWDERDTDEEFSLFGLPADSDWVLYAPLIYDRALINNPLAYEMSRQVGRWAARTRACELYLNTGGGKVTQSDYVGVYFVMEKIRINKDRLDIGKLEPWDSTEPKVSGGYILAVDRADGDPGEERFSAANQTFNYIDTPAQELTDTQKNWIRNYISDLGDALYGSEFTDPYQGYAKYMDVPSHVDHSLLNVLTFNVDAFRLSGYLYKERGAKLFAGPVWDFDRAFESTDNRDNNPEVWYSSGGTDFFNYVWYGRLHDDIDFWQKYIDRWYELRLDQFSTENLNSIIDSMADEIREAADRNYARWSSYPPRFGGFQGEIDHMKNWLATRASWIDRQFVRPPRMTPDGGYVAAGATVTLSNPNGSGTIYYTLDGSDPRQFGSSSGEVVTLLEEDAPKRILVPSGPVNDDWRGGSEPFDDSGWNHGNYVADKTGGIGYDENPSYLPYVSYDVGSLMNADWGGSNTSCLVRIPFSLTAEDLAQLSSLTLRVRCDDGFVAFLNGAHPLGAKTTNAPDPGDLAWDSSSNGAGPESSAFKTYDISSEMGRLKAGENLLAIHALNAGLTSSDFLISAMLEGGISSTGDSNTPGGISPIATVYDGTPITLDISTRINARVLVGSNPYSRWSGLAKVGFGVTPVAESLRITEIMYHPQDTNDPEDPNEEYIELQNIGPETINLNRVRFTNGIYFTFGDIDVGPGEFVVVVAKQSAFEARYPDFSGILAGEYRGRLDNDGERIQLEDAIGHMIHDFSYKDGWRSITDGDGFSLTIIDTAEVPPTVSEDGLVGHWKLDDGSGSTAIDSAGTNHGTVHGDPTWTAGRMDGALNLDGAGDYISAAASEPLKGSRATVAAWVRVTGLTGIWNPVLTQHLPNNDGYYFYIYDDKPAFSVMVGGVDMAASSPDTIDWNEWHHLAGTNDGSTIRVYVDGTMKASRSSSSSSGADYDMYIGHAYVSAANFCGLIDDVRIYDRPLSDYEFGLSSNVEDRWGEKDSWRPSVYMGGSPGWDDSGILPNPGDVVINEILAHAHGAEPDWIELHNTTDSQIDIGGWYLSDDREDPKKYRIAAGTKIDGGGYKVFYEDTHFGEASPDPGRLTGFAFSENGDRAYLSSGEGEEMTGYRVSEDFGASYRGVSFGRYFKKSTGNTNFVSMERITPGEKNAYPRVGPVVISEIMYNPQSGDQNQEFIELHNISSQPVTLYDSSEGAPWRLTDGVSFTFPDYPGLTLNPGGRAVLVKDVASYMDEYGMPPFGVVVLGPYGGSLSNSGEKVQLSAPGDVDHIGVRHYIRIDRVTYSDGSHPESCPGDIDYWPIEADGGGMSLDRIDPSLYGNDPNNWRQRPPTPGLED